LPAKRSANVVFYFHANAEDLGVVHSALVHLQKQLQVSVLAIEYPGYGLLKDQTPSEDAICSAALVALRYIVSEIGVGYQQVMLLGRSLGSGPAVYLASRFPVGGLLLVNPFASLRGAAACHVGKAISRFAFADCFNNEDAIGNVSCAVLFIHAARDRTVPMEHSARLFKKCRSRKLLVTPEGMEHNSHLFADPAYLAVPAIHFFHFPCYQTDKPPTLPPHVFKAPSQFSTRRADCRNFYGWSCSSKFCASKFGGASGENDEETVPAGASLLGHVDVSDKVLPKESSRAENMSSSFSAKMRLSPCPTDDASKVGAFDTASRDSEASFGPDCRYPAAAEVGPGPNLPSVAPAPVAPGDESAGRPLQDIDLQAASKRSVPLDKLGSIERLPDGVCDIEV
jgi:pimeloyl-ACP methyl ester carboxylesterase